MDVIASPLITVLANVVADLLVSKGIIDSGSKLAVIQTINNSMAAVMTLGIGVYSTYKMVELQKHKATLTHSAPLATKTETVVQVSQPISQTIPTSPVGQMGTPESTTTVPNVPVVPV